MSKKFEVDGKDVHPHVPELCDQLRSGRCGRRDFLRTITLLGVSAAAAYTLASQILGEDISVIGKAQAQTPKKGGRLRSSMRVQRMDDPATYDWTQMSNQTRHILEYLTITGPDNITRPYLAKSWNASEDLKTWTFYLQEGVKWSNGDDFGADDVIYNMKRWLDPATGSSNLSLFSELTEQFENERKMIEGSIEKVDEHTVRFHLGSAQLAMPENFYNYPTAIVHRRFEEEGGDFSKNPVGTGPYELAEFLIGERCLLRRRSDVPYWGGEVYLDEILYIDHGDDPMAGIAALASGQVDHVYEVDINSLDIVERLPNAVIQETKTAQTGVVRMRVTEEPFDNPLVRKALLASLDNARLLEIAYRGRGDVGEDFHVAPVHPEYYNLPDRKRDVELAKKHLADAGYPEGITLKLDFGKAEAWHLNLAQGIREQAQEAGINVELNPMPGASYWDVWDKTPFGITQWTHRPLGVMVLNLGYRSGVAWNETNYSNPEFDKALDAAGGILDVEERRKAMEKVERIMQEDAVANIPLWRSVFAATSKVVKGYTLHPTFYHQFNDVWIDS